MKVNFGQPSIDTQTNILDIEIPEQMKNSIPTGNVYMDSLFAGDGILPSTVALVTGVPGAGKSTLMMQQADALTGAGHIALYNANEESLYQVKRVVNRLQLRNGFVVGYNREVDDIIKHANKLKEENPGKKIFVFIDSLQTLEASRKRGQKGRNLSRLNVQVEATERLTAWAKESFDCVFIIGQVTKAGEFTGKQDIKHIVDCHLHLAFHREHRHAPEERFARMEKNRFGVAGIYHNFSLSARGIQFSLPSDIDDDDDDEDNGTVEITSTTDANGVTTTTATLVPSP